MTTTAGDEDERTSRPAVRAQWEAVLAGCCSAEAAAEWAADRIAADSWDEELVLQGLLQLTSLPGRTADPETLTRWLAELDNYDEDPGLWMERYFQELLRGHAHRRGTEAAARFGDRLVAAGQLSSAAVQRALEEL